MAENANGTTPAQAVTLPSSQSGQATPSAASPAPAQNGNGDQSVGTVTISTKEYADLQRAKARQLSFERRASLPGNRGPAPQANGKNGQPLDPDVAETIHEANSAREEAELRARRLEVKDKVRDLLAKPEYANIPQSTKDLIMRNPSSLSEAATIDEAMIDIEDFLIDHMGTTGTGTNGAGNGGSSPSPTPGHETPPARASGPVTPKGDETEDVSKLTGSARSRAIIRNIARTKRTGA